MRRNGRGMTCAVALSLLLPAATTMAATTVVLPRGAGPDTVSLSTTWSHRAVDVGLVIDCTGGMSSELQSLRTGFPAAASQLQASYPDLRVGIADFEDWPCDGHGLASAGDLPFRLFYRCTANLQNVQSLLNALLIRNGGDIPESGYDAVHQAVTGAGVDVETCALVPPFDPASLYVPGVADGPDGGMGFRNGAATAVLVVFTDAVFHESSDYAFPGPASRVQAVTALAGSGYRLAAILSDPANSAALTQLRELSMAASTITPPAHGSNATMCETGLGGAPVAPVSGSCPGVYLVSTSGSGIATALVSSVANALDASPYTLTTTVEGTALPPGGTSADFVLERPFTGGSNPAFAPPPEVYDGGNRLLGSYASGAAGRRVVLRNLAVDEVDSVQHYPIVVETRATGTVVARDTIVVEIPRVLAVPPGAEGRGLRMTPLSRNPFTGRFAAQLTLPEAGPVRVRVYDAAGRRVRTLAEGPWAAGRHAVEWDGCGEDGSPASAGLYFLRATWRGEQAGLRITRLR